jgi:hypothetical protein
MDWDWKFLMGQYVMGCNVLICVNHGRLCTVFTCGRCGIVQYCSKECQMKDWQFHKKVCVNRKESAHVDRTACELATLNTLWRMIMSQEKKGKDRYVFIGEREADVRKLGVHLHELGKIESIHKVTTALVEIASRSPNASIYMSDAQELDIVWANFL